MKVKELIDILSKFDQDLELYTYDWSEWDVDYIYHKYNGSPRKVPSKKHNEQWDKQYHIGEKYFICL